MENKKFNHEVYEKRNEEYIFKFGSYKVSVIEETYDKKLKNLFDFAIMIDNEFDFEHPIHIKYAEGNLIEHLTESEVEKLLNEVNKEYILSIAHYDKNKTIYN